MNTGKLLTTVVAVVILFIGITAMMAGMASVESGANYTDSSYEDQANSTTSLSILSIVFMKYGMIIGAFSIVLIAIIGMFKIKP